MSIPFYSNIDMNSNIIENAENIETITAVDVDGTWISWGYPEGQQITDELPVNDFNKLIVGNTLSWASRTTSGATVKTSILAVYDWSGQTSNTNTDYLAKRITYIDSNGNLSNITVSTDETNTYIGSNLNDI